MADFTDSVRVTAEVTALFDYLADVSNLPHYFSRIVEATPGDGEEVHTTAVLPDGQQVQGRAWFRVLPEAHRIEWGSEGSSDYHGWLQVRSVEDGSEVEVHLHTVRVGPDSTEVPQGIEETLDRIKHLNEG